jgi:hypothetical protein
MSQCNGKRLLLTKVLALAGPFGALHPPDFRESFRNVVPANAGTQSAVEGPGLRTGNSY